MPTNLGLKEWHHSALQFYYVELPREPMLAMSESVLLDIVDYSERQSLEPATFQPSKINWTRRRVRFLCRTGVVDLQLEHLKLFQRPPSQRSFDWNIVSVRILGQTAGWHNAYIHVGFAAARTIYQAAQAQAFTQAEEIPSFLQKRFRYPIASLYREEWEKVASNALEGIFHQPPA